MYLRASGILAVLTPPQTSDNTPTSLSFLCFEKPPEAGGRLAVRCFTRNIISPEQNTIYHNILPLTKNAQ